MPALETSDLTEFAVLWAGDGTYDAEGEPQVGEPVQVPVRWNPTGGKTQDVSGNILTYDASIAVDRQLKIGDRIWLGTLQEFNGTGSAGEASQIMRVLTTSTAKDVKGEATRYEATLKLNSDKV